MSSYLETCLTVLKEKTSAMSLSCAMFMPSLSVRIAMQDFIAVAAVLQIHTASTDLLQILMISVANFKKRELNVQ